MGQYLGMKEMESVLSVLIPRYKMHANVTFDTLDTHWDIANQPNIVHKVTIERRNVCINLCGAHSTGKTHLINQLREDLEPDPVSGTARFSFIVEIARGIMSERSWNRDTLSAHPSVLRKLQTLILMKQNDVESNAIRLGHSFVSDRGLDPLAYLLFYCHKGEFHDACNLPCVKSMVKRCIHHSLVIILAPTTQCLQDDGIRWTSDLDESNRFSRCMKIDVLKRFNIPFFEIPACVPLEHRKLVVLCLLKAAGGL